MSEKTFSEIEASVEQLDLRDQVRLLQHLAPRIAKAVLTSIPPSDQVHAEAWRRFRELGDQLASTSKPGAASLTEAVSEMRR